MRSISKWDQLTRTCFIASWLITSLHSLNSLAQPQFKWVDRYPDLTYSDDHGNSICINQDNNIVYVGHSSNGTSNGNENSFFGIRDTAGNNLWTYHMGKVNVTTCTPLQVRTDTAGYIYILLNFSGKLYFNNDTLTSPHVAPGFALIKLQDSNLVWSYEITQGSTGPWQYRFLEVTPNGTSYISVPFYGTQIFGTDTLIASSSREAALIKLNGQGKVKWARLFYGDWDFGLATNAKEEVYLLRSQGAISSVGHGNCFLLRIDSSGNMLHSQKIIGFGGRTEILGFSYSDKYGFDLALKTYQPATTIHGNILYAKQVGTFIARYDTAFQFIKANKLMDVPNNQYQSFIISDIITDDYGQVVLGGPTFDTVFFRLDTMAYRTFYLIKLDSSFNFRWKKEFAEKGFNSSTQIGEFAMLNEDLYFSANPDGQPSLTFDSFFYNSTKWNDLFFAKLTLDIDTVPICPSTFGYAKLHLCDSMISPSQNHIWYNTGRYLDTLTNYKGCDSIIIIDLVLDSSEYQITRITSCKPYTWTLNNITYTQSGTFKQWNVNSNGCDSLSILDLTIENIDTSISVAGSLLTSNDTNCLYQWVDCSNGFIPIPGETSKSYSPTIIGTYAVVILKNGCLDTSSGHVVTKIGLPENNTSTTTKIFPNPTTKQLTLDFKEKNSSGQLIITDLQGKIIQIETFNNVSTLYTQISSVTGVYLIKVEFMNGVAETFRIFKL